MMAKINKETKTKSKPKTKGTGGDVTAKVKAKNKVGEKKSASSAISTTNEKAANALKSAEIRTPIVAVLGHVDHGKTSLLDAIRGTSVQTGEEGGITQNTRSHKVDLKANWLKNSSPVYPQITFIDTPGHEAFTEMRSRGARVADIAMLVVAADDGVQPQTKESIKFIKKAGLPIVVACNKIDAPGANIERVKQQLSQNDVLVEEFGGDVVFVPVSAIKKEGISDLLENIVLVAELNELKQTPPVQGLAEGFVLESNTNKDLGPVAMIILKSGNLEKGQFLYAGGMVHKIRATLNEEQKQTDGAKQGDPVWVIGLNSVLPIGENVLSFASNNEAESLLKEVEQEEIAEKEEEEEVADEDIFAQLVGSAERKADEETQLKVILKADTQGTLEAIIQKLKDLSYENARVEIFEASPGGITETDVQTARDVRGIVLGFQVKVDKNAQILASRERILVRTYKIIYDLIDEVDVVIQSMIQPEEVVVDVAVAEIKEVFKLTNGKLIAGSVVTDGNVVRGYKVYVRRGKEKIGEAKITSLKHLKEDVKEAKKGTECGIMLEPQIELEVGDEVVCFKIEK